MDKYNNDWFWNADIGYIYPTIYGEVVIVHKGTDTAVYEICTDGKKYNCPYVYSYGGHPCVLSDCAKGNIYHHYVGRFAVKWSDVHGGNKIVSTYTLRDAFAFSCYINRKKHNHPDCACQGTQIVDTSGKIDSHDLIKKLLVLSELDAMGYTSLSYPDGVRMLGGHNVRISKSHVIGEVLPDGTERPIEYFIDDNLGWYRLPCPAGKYRYLAKRYGVRSCV